MNMCPPPPPHTNYRSSGVPEHGQPKINCLSKFFPFLLAYLEQLIGKTASNLNRRFHTLTQEKVGHWSMILQLAQMVVQHAKFSLHSMEQHEWIVISRSLNVGIQLFIIWKLTQ